MKTLVTGGSGNVGAAVTAALLDAGHAVRVFDLKEPAVTAAEFVCGDVTDPHAVEAAVQGVDAVVHLAAIPALRPDVPAVDYIHVNVAGTCNVLEAAARHDVGKVVFASSDSTLGFVFSTHPFSPDYLPIDEAHPLRPQDAYGLSKLMGEELCQSATRRYGLHTVALRFCWVWFDDTYAQRADVLKGDPQVQAKTMWGHVGVRDAAQACRLAVEHPDLPPYDVFFITAEDTYADAPSLDLIRTHYPDVKEVDEAHFATPYAGLFDISKARTRLGYAPQCTCH